VKNVVHVISLLRELGGVQQSFISYYKYAQKYSKYKQYVYSTHERSKKYGAFKNFFLIKKNIFSFLVHLYSRNSIIYFHNKLSSKIVYYLLKFMPSNNIIFHEHGEAWNVKTSEQKKIYQANAKMANKIIVNSIATESMLIKKFKINEAKIKLAYYGFANPKIKKKKNKTKKNLQVGLIARLESVKGAHILIEAAKILRNKNIDFLIGGDGHLEKALKKLSKNNNKVKFVGNVINPFDFIKKLDILVVPSIREPLGIVNIEAGYCKIPVIASKVDGIPEVVFNNYSGVLINPTKKINRRYSRGLPPLPNFVINPNTFDLSNPKEIDPKKLSKIILYLSKNEDLRLEYGYNLYKYVKSKFSIKNYFKRLESICYNLDED
jgi:glycosyltransferase involved in cell wall biosynthesis